jgi:biopolymer transport protein ExbD
MSSSLRARRMARNHRRRAGQPRLNLVALMDIFTILVLFLMVNNGDVEVLQADSEVSLPESISEQRPELALTIKITDTHISVQGRPVEAVATALSSPESVLPGLAQALRQQAELEPGLTEQQQLHGRAVIIMGDQEMPYRLLKRIMTTCAQGDYRDISLAVDSNPPAPITPGQAPSAQLAMGGA